MWLLRANAEQNKNVEMLRPRQPNRAYDAKVCRNAKAYVQQQSENENSTCPHMREHRACHRSLHAAATRKKGGRKGVISFCICTGGKTIHSQGALPVENA